MVVVIIIFFSSNLVVALLLVFISFGIYALQTVLFHSPRDTIFYLFQDLAFVPLQVIIVTLVLDRLLSLRDKREKLKKINVVISAFYSEAGTEMLSLLSGFCTNLSILKPSLDVKSDWKDSEFKSAVKAIGDFDYQIEVSSEQFVLLRDFLRTKKDYMLGMFENPNLLEHDTFTDMLWAVFHAADELDIRNEFARLPQTDLEHLVGDVKRAFQFLLIEWIYYINYLQKEYPYLFSLAVRKNPFAAVRKITVE